MMENGFKIDDKFIPLQGLKKIGIVKKSFTLLFFEIQFIFIYENFDCLQYTFYGSISTNIQEKLQKLKQVYGITLESIN